jgi:hypothetical protein
MQSGMEILTSESKNAKFVGPVAKQPIIAGAIVGHPETCLLGHGKKWWASPF